MPDFDSSFSTNKAYVKLRHPPTPPPPPPASPPTFTFEQQGRMQSCISSSKHALESLEQYTQGLKNM